MQPLISVEESKVLFALLDAAADYGLLRRASADVRWREARTRLVDFPCERESGLMWDLLRELELSGVLENTWILERWRTIQSQVSRSKDLAHASMESSTRNTPPFFARHYRT